MWSDSPCVPKDDLCAPAQAEAQATGGEAASKAPACAGAQVSEYGFTFSGRSAESGFTLIEMLVALAIFSLAALALLRLEGATLTGTARLADTTMAQIVARNLAVDVMTSPRPPAFGDDQGSVVNGGATWHWTRNVTRTDDVRIARINLQVADQAGRTLTRLSIARAVQ